MAISGRDQRAFEEVHPSPAGPRLPYQALLDTLPDVVLVADDHGRYVGANSAAVKLLGYTEQEILLLHVEDVVAGSPETLEALGRDLVDAPVWRGQIELRRKDGSTFGAEGRAYRVGDLAVTVIRETGPRIGGLVGSTPAELAAIVESSNDAIFSKTLDGILLSWNRGAERIYGYRAEEVIGRHVSMLAPPERKEEISDILRRLRRGEEIRDFRTRRVTRDGRIREMWLSISPIRDATGTIAGAATIARDVTEQARIEAELQLARERLSRDITELKSTERELRFRKLLLEAQTEASDEGILVMSPDGELMSWNNRFLELMGFTPQVMDGVSRAELLEMLRPSLLDPDGVLDRIRRVWERPEAEARDQIAFVNGRVVERFSTPLRDVDGHLYGRASFFRDVTEERRRELAQRFLAEASRELVSSLDYEATLERIASLAVPQLADWCTVDVLEPGGEVRLLAVAHVDPEKVRWAGELRKRFPTDPTAEQGLANVIRTGRSELHAVVSPQRLESAAGGDPEILEIFRELRIRSVMIVPLVARGRTLGAMQFVWAESGRSYDEDDLRLAEDVAGRAALALDNARLYRERDQIAQTLQQSLLPGALPTIEGIRLAARYRAAGRGVEVGGDFYDVFEVGGGAHAFAVGDVCGKGPKAAALMGAARHTIRTAAIQERRPSEVLRVLNTALLQRMADRWFCTVAYVRARRGADGVRLTISCGGHPLPAVLRAGGEVELVGRPGTLLGVFADVELSDAVVDLRPGDSLVLYTDGVTDQLRDGEEFGLERFAEVLRDSAGRPPDEIANAIEEAVVAYGSEEPTDDLALLVAKVVD
jgi:PAS domain S-box-containing protein